MNQAQHTKLRQAKWRYDPVSDRYSAPGVALDGTQRMYTQAEAWAALEAAEGKDKAKTKDERPVQE